MKRLALSLAPLVAIACPAPLAAQDGPGPEAELALKCAIWASYFSASYDGEPESAAFTRALSYFVGRYEGLTGKGIDKAMDQALIVATAENLDAMTPLCIDRMDGYATRLSEWGKALEAIGDRLPEDEGPTS